MTISENDIFDCLMQTIMERKRNPSGDSYTAHLLAKGAGKICEKISEESGEVVQAAGESDPNARQHQIHEAADLIYHLWVLLAHQGIELDEIRRELERRFGTSGIAEKASRKSDPGRA